MPAREIPRGEMTPEQRKDAQRLDNLRRYLRQTGRSSLVQPHEFKEARKKVADYHRRGMRYRDMADQTGYVRHLFGKVAGGRQKTLQRDTYDAIMGMKFKTPDAHLQCGSSTVDPCGSRRRIEALRAISFPETFLAEWLGRCQPNKIRFHQVGGIWLSTAAQVADMYDKLKDRDPREFGISEATIKKVATAVHKHRFAPPHCWDSDTIDDPNAIPEWTGYCGTVQGRSIHRRENIPMCDACRYTTKSVDRGYGVFDRNHFEHLLKMRGVSLADLAETPGLTRASIDSWCSGRRQPTPERLDVLAQALGVTPQELCE